MSRLRRGPVGRLVCTGAVLLVLALAGGCKGSFELRVDGSLTNGIDFLVRDADGRPLSVPLRELEVRAEGEAERLWHIAGSGTLGRVRYGEVPDGFEVLVEAQELEPGGRYRVSGAGGRWPEPPSSGDVLFELTEGGLAFTVFDYDSLSSGPDLSPYVVDCIYVSKVSVELEPHAACGKLTGERLQLDPQHLERLSFAANGLGWVLTGEGAFYVDASGRSVRTHWYDAGPDTFVEGVARGISRGKFGFIDPALDFVIEPRFDFAFPFEQGHAVVCNGCWSRPEGEHSVIEGGVWGVIDRRGELVVPLEYPRDELPSEHP